MDLFKCFVDTGSSIATGFIKFLGLSFIILFYRSFGAKFKILWSIRGWRYFLKSELSFGESLRVITCLPPPPKRVHTDFPISPFWIFHKKYPLCLIVNQNSSWAALIIFPLAWNNPEKDKEWIKKTFMSFCKVNPWVCFKNKHQVLFQESLAISVRVIKEKHFLHHYHALGM